MKRNAIFSVLSLAIAVIVSGCFTIKVNMSGASVHPDAKTFSVQDFINRADEIQPGLTLDFYNALRDKVESQTSLNFTSGYGDIDFTGEIVRYNHQSTAITSNEVAALNRFSIAVKVDFNNVMEPENNFSKTFERYQEFDASENFENVKVDLTEKIIEEIINDIFKEAFINW